MNTKTFVIDRKKETVPTDFSWQLGLGNDHAYMIHRSDVCAHIKLAHEELGIRYIRCHGIFDDDMLTYQRMGDYRMFRGIPHKNEIEEINFRQVGHVFDNLLDCGVKPFVELSFMPTALASGKKLGLRYNNNITMPKSLDRWSAYIEAFIRFLLHRYGEEEVESWYFEVWNEPDLDCFFAGSQKDYFRLYEVTARTIKKVDAKLRVGGPSTSACLWIEDFIKFCQSNQVPYDFVSTHHYPGDAFGNLITAKSAIALLKTAKESAKNHVPLSDTMAKMFFYPEDYKKWDKGILGKMDDETKKKVGKDTPLFITEWNSMAVFSAPVHDEKFSSAFVIKTCMDFNGATAANMFWCCSDLFEEQFMLPKPFVGSYGIVSNDGIPKPNFWAFKLLSQLFPNRLQLPMRTNEAVELAAFIDGEKTQILVYAQDPDYNKQETTEVILRLNQKASKVSVQRIDDTHCNPKAEWIALGRPDNLTRKQVQEIKDRTRLISENLNFELSGEETVITLRMQTHDVALITVE